MQLHLALGFFLCPHVFRAGPAPTVSGSPQDTLGFTLWCTEKLHKCFPREPVRVWTARAGLCAAYAAQASLRLLRRLGF